MKNMTGKIVLALLLAVAVNFVWSYFSLMKTTEHLASDLGVVRSLASSLKVSLNDQILYNKRLQEDKVILGRELASAQEEISRSKEAIGKLEQDLDSLKIHVSSLENRNILLKSRLETLAMQKKKFETQLDELIKEKEKLEASFYSLEKLNKAIRYLKANPSQQHKVNLEKSKDNPVDNKGFLMKGGKTTYKSNVDIRVLPAP